MSLIKNKVEFEHKICELENDITRFETSLRTSFVGSNGKDNYLIAHRVSTECDALKRKVNELLQHKTFDCVLNMKIDNAYNRAIIFILKYEDLLNKDIPLSGDLLSIDASNYRRNIEKRSAFTQHPTR